jgi:hypothetical protein
MAYHLIGKRVRVHLYTREGVALGAVTGRVADFAAAVPVGKSPRTGEDVKKDLVWVVDIETPDGTPYKNSLETENEGWFAVQDVVVVGDDPPGAPVSYN